MTETTQQLNMCISAKVTCCSHYGVYLLLIHLFNFKSYYWNQTTKNTKFINLISITNESAVPQTSLQHQELLTSHLLPIYFHWCYLLYQLRLSMMKRQVSMHIIIDKWQHVSILIICSVHSRDLVLPSHLFDVLLRMRVIDHSTKKPYICA